MKINTSSIKLIGDLVTPVGLLLKIRKEYGNALLLETSSYSVREGSRSMICFNSLDKIEIDKGRLTNRGQIKTEFDVYGEIKEFMAHFELQKDEHYDFQAIFGYTTYNAVQQFEQISFDASKMNEDIPDLRYDFYRNLIVFDHFHESIIVIDNCPEKETSNLHDIAALIRSRELTTGTFKVTGDEKSNITDQEYMDMVSLGKRHCKRGDVFQIVLSRKYYTPFEGDDFNLYRALRAINPSPYLFYFNYGHFRILGSSPEAQLKVEGGIAEIHPIAGTYRRTGDEELDTKMAKELAEDPKEVAEHVMLVDLARNDLSRNSSDVRVVDYKIIQYFSHVIHLVSKVIGDVRDKTKAVHIYGDTFPAGTLSGAPKYKAMSLIDKYEPNGRSFYGGGIGLFKFNGELDHAIMIRTFLSKDNQLIRQAGAGIVMKSNEESELMEVNNKLAALRKALELAQSIDNLKD